jgi:MoaA/NifB/PqqE/SkfB family radical SAM enzyme
MRDVANVGFFYTAACPLRCNFCCHTPEVVGPGRLSVPAVTRVIQDFARQPSVVRFFFSGGDPFVFLGEILQILAACRADGVRQPFHLVTAGYWARSEARTMDLLRRLHALGVELHLSYDTEHARFVPREYILRIVEGCATLGMTVKIFGTFWNQDERVEDLLPTVQGVVMGSSLVAPVGAARPHFEGPRYELAEAAKHSCGRPADYDVGIYPNGDAYPCCSGGFNKEAQLGCGNVFEDDAATILERVFRFFHVRVAKQIGFDKLYAKVKATRPELLERLTPFAQADTPCEICRDLRADAELQRELAPILEALKAEHTAEVRERALAAARRRARLQVLPFIQAAHPIAR